MSDKTDYEIPAFLRKPAKQVKQRPILFSAPMIRALLNGSKTQTRRIVKLPHLNPLGLWEATTIGGKGIKTASGMESIEQTALWHTRTGDILGCPYGYAGDQLWVRETFCPDWCDKPIYKADGGSAIDAGYSKEPRWKPSIHMPRWASRITLEITGVRVERLNDCSEADAISEGIERVGGVASVSPWRNYRIGEEGEMSLHCSAPTRSYMSLWESINGASSWAANPWVWVVEFKVVKS
jgi:hypothetical protein